MMLPLILVSAITLTLSTAAHAACDTLSTEAGRVGFCITAPARSSNPDIVYFFHAAMPPTLATPERLYENGEIALLRLWGDSPPTMVTISWGPRWILKDGKVPALAREIIPAVERRLPPVKRRRLLVGLSMGGLNAFIAWALLPDLFDRAAFLCPAFRELSPFADRSAHLRLMAEHSHAVYANDFSVILRPLFTTEAEWAMYQPPGLLARLRPSPLPPVFISYSSTDHFGAGGAPSIEAAGHTVTVETNSGVHCAGVFTDKLGEFLRR